MKKELADSNSKVDYLEEELFKTNQRVADMEKRLGDLSLEGNKKVAKTEFIAAVDVDGG